MTGQLYPIFRETDGLNTKADPSRLAIDEKTGRRSMARAVNVFVDDFGELQRCPGMTLKDAAVTRVWGDGGIPGLAIKGGNLCFLGESGGVTALSSLSLEPLGLSAARYADLLFWTTGREHGYIAKGVVFPWTKSSFVPEADQDKSFAGAPIGSILAEFASRMLVARDNILYYSEIWDPFTFRLATNYKVFFHNITMVAPVADGFWISDGVELFFCKGLDPLTWIPLRKGIFGVHAGQYARIMGGDTSYEKLQGSGYAWKAGTAQGLITLGDGGFVAHDTSDTIETGKDPYPLSATKGCAGGYGGHVLYSYEP